MREDISSLDHIRSNAKTLGGMLGAQEQFLDNARHLGDEFWVDRSVLNIQDITYQQIERTPLGRAIKLQLQKLEEKSQGLQNNLKDYLAKQKARDAYLQEKTEKEFIKRFADRQEKAK